MANTWTERHADEAKAALLRLAADALSAGDLASARAICLTASREDATTSIGAFVAALALHLDPRVDAAKLLATARARAEGREVVETEVFWRVRFADGSYIQTLGGTPIRFAKCEDANAAASNATKQGDLRVVRVTLTRRRILPKKPSTKTKGGG